MGRGGAGAAGERGERLRSEKLPVLLGSHRLSDERVVERHGNVGRGCHSLDQSHDEFRISIITPRPQVVQGAQYVGMIGEDDECLVQGDERLTVGQNAARLGQNVSGARESAEHVPLDLPLVQTSAHGEDERGTGHGSNKT